MFVPKAGTGLSVTAQQQLSPAQHAARVIICLGVLIYEIRNKIELIIQNRASVIFLAPHPKLSNQLLLYPSICYLIFF